MANKDQWQAAAREILDRLDLLAEYRALGVDIAGEPGATGWAPCRAFGREDKTPSAGVCVAGDRPQLGRYKEHSGDGRNLSFFEFAAEVRADLLDWREARRYYAKQTGVKLPAGTDQNPADALDFADFDDHAAKIWATLHKPGVDPAAMKLCGIRPAVWRSQPVWAIEVFGPDASVIGFQVWPRAGRALRIPQGPGKPVVYRKISTVAGSKAGWMNRHAIENIEAAEVVWCVEGPSDMVALQSIVDSAGHIVLANSGGAMQTPTAELIEPLRGKVIRIIRDTDQPGERGARRWADAIAPIAAEVRIVRLPYPVTEDHGKDLRDWLLSIEGAKWAQLFVLAAEAESEPKPAADSGGPGSAADGPESPAQHNGQYAGEEILLEELGLHIVGCTPGGDAEIYSDRQESVFTRSPSRMALEDVLQICGSVARERIHTAPDPVAGQYHLSEVKKAIALLSGRPAPRGGRVGQGVWLGLDRRRQPDGTVVAVGAGEAAIWDGQRLHRRRAPRYGELEMELWDCDPWFEFEQLESLINRAADYKWCEAALTELETAFKRWNWRSRYDPLAMTGMVLATWVQATLPWRPQVAVSGSTNAGKSLLFELLRRLFGKLEMLSSQSTAAGIRQAIGHSSRVILCDEFDSMKAAEEVLEMLRASGRGDRVLRGTAGGQRGLTFELHHIAWLAGINVSLQRAPDRNRFVRHELLPAKIGEHGKLSIPDGDELADLGQRLLAIGIRYCQAGACEAGKLRKVQFPEHDGRVVESYSVPAGMMGAAFGVPGNEFLSAMLSAVPREGVIRDETSLLETILSSSVRSKEYGERAVSQLLGRTLNRPEGDQESLDCLERVGVRLAEYTPKDDRSGQCLVLAYRVVRESLLRGSEWSKQAIDQILARLPDASVSRRRVGGASQPCVLLDLNWVLSEFCDEEEVLGF